MILRDDTVVVIIGDDSGMICGALWWKKSGPRRLEVGSLFHYGLIHAFERRGIEAQSTSCILFCFVQMERLWVGQMRTFSKIVADWKWSGPK